MGTSYIVERRNQNEMTEELQGLLERFVWRTSFCELLSFPNTEAHMVDSPDDVVIPYMRQFDDGENHKWLWWDNRVESARRTDQMKKAKEFATRLGVDGDKLEQKEKLRQWKSTLQGVLDKWEYEYEKSKQK